MGNLFSNTALVTRNDVSSFTQILLIVFLITIVLWFVGSVIYYYKVKKNKKQKRVVTRWRRYSMLLGIISDIILFYTGASLFMMLFLLATIEIDVLLKEYLLFILLVSFFANVLSFVVLFIISKVYLKKRKRKTKYFKEFCFSLAIMTLISDGLILIIFPKPFHGIAISLIATSLIIFLIGCLILSLKLKKQNIKRKRNKRGS